MLHAHSSCTGLWSVLRASTEVVVQYQPHTPHTTTTAAQGSLEQDTRKEVQQADDDADDAGDDRS
jgi:hypothetical protein